MKFPKGVLYPSTKPIYDAIKWSTLRVICRQSVIKSCGFLFFETKILLQYLSWTTEQTFAQMMSKVPPLAHSYLRILYLFN